MRSRSRVIDWPVDVARGSTQTISAYDNARTRRMARAQVAFLARPDGKRGLNLNRRGASRQIAEPRSQSHSFASRITPLQPATILRLIASRGAAIPAKRRNHSAMSARQTRGKHARNRARRAAVRALDQDHGPWRRSRALLRYRR